MTKPLVPYVRAIIVNIIPIALMWIVAFAAVQLVERASGPRQLSEAGILTAIVIAAVLAWKLHARAAFFFLAFCFAWNAALLVGHLRYGVLNVNGGPVQATIGVACLFSFAMGALVSRKRFVAAS